MNSDIHRRLVLEEKFHPNDVGKFLEQVHVPIKDDNEIGRVEICIMKYKAPEVESECLDLLVKNTDHPYKLNFFDNRPNTGNTAKMWNKFMEEATCEHVVIMDTDAYVTEGWLKPLYEAFQDNPDCALAVPVIGQSGGPRTQQHNRSERRSTKTNGHVSGFCFMTTKTIWRELGGFDEEYYIFGQDSAYCQTILNHETYNPYLVYRSLVFHGKEIDSKKGVWDFSKSTTKAAEDGEFIWKLDTSYSHQLMKIKFPKNYTT